MSVHQSEIAEKYAQLYPGSDSRLEKVFQMMAVYYNNREKHLVKRDLEGIGWTNSGHTVGMMLYVDLFSGNLENLIKKSSHFEKLGVTLLHLMPVLEPRSGENDGGYAVKSYRDIDPRIGDMAIFSEVTKHYHQKGIRICIDYVINHTAEDHEWAQKAIAGDETYQNYYLMYEDETLPKQFEQTLNEVFPKVAPGNFTYHEALQKWIMTTFYPFQWDLNYRNPDVFYEMVSNLLFFANSGVDMIRLDAIPYIWKTIGTSCRNLPEVHLLLSLFRDIVNVCAPSTALLGEAIISPELIIKYFGSPHRLECHGLYNASYMVEIWNAIATRDARHIAWMPTYEVPEESTWINYARCHDDIGWGLDEKKLRDMGFDPQAHKAFLIDFYLGSLKDSFSMGELYEFDPVNLDARNSGTLASLAGLEKAMVLSDRYQKELAYKRIILIHALFILRKGIPMLYSGDEVATLNDYSYKADAHKKNDSRWLHRPTFNWHNQSPVFGWIHELIELRRQVYGDVIIQNEHFISGGNKHILIILQNIVGENMPYMLLYNLTEDRQWVYTSELKRFGFHGKWLEALQGKEICLDDETILMGPYEFFIIKNKKDLHS